ncbi:MAG: tyrosinase [Acidobacteriota bacterium]|jgi:tyrosinase|nr:tyrosinase [Acidobacteriota bacterium]
MADESQDKQPQAASRYERVKKILDTAQGATTPSYQGLGHFWNLPLEKFLTATLYGIRLIAPPSEPDPCDDIINSTPARSCCQDDEPASVALPPPPEGGGGGGHSCCGSMEMPGGDGGKSSKGRGAASGLIKGLKGQFPFDGTQFPQLMWGGQKVSASDIIFIQSWIDDGCPASDETKQTLAQVNQPIALARARGDEEHPLSTKTVNEFSLKTNKIKVRKNIECLSPDELERFRRVIRVMKCYDDFHQYDQRSFRFWADIHANNCQHGWEQFLTWHRLYLYYFEQQMQDIDPTVTLPYWDWTMYSENVLASIDDMKATSDSLDNGTIPKAYRCRIDQRTLDNLHGKIPDDNWSKLKALLDKDGGKDNVKGYNSGLRFFSAAGIKYGADTDLLIINELSRVNPLWIWNRWPGGNANLIFEAWPTPDDVKNILKIKSFYNFGSGPDSNHFFGACENIHNLIHNFSGGANPNYTPANRQPQYGYMQSAGTTARDPIFWAHHSNVDRLYSEWQGLHPGGGPDDPEDVLAPWPNHVKDVETISDLGYEYMMSSYVFETNSQLPIARFKSAATAVHPAVLQHHSRAEIRLHKVQYSTSGGAFVRVFLNEPDASADTPTRGNDHFVAQLATFSGECIGGPGHCDVPSESRRKYDIRPRHRKTPGNFRIDATDAVRHLIEEGETDFQVNLVVLDIDGTAKPNALWMEGVSLNFKD